jgi:hypothetical protein
VAAALLVADGTWDTGTMVNVEELDPHPFIDWLDRLGLPTQMMEITPGSSGSFPGEVGDIADEMKRATATVTVSAVDPLIAVR